jgi:cellulose synthase/poly-beta-1,6-N-acetylglucosamine synthase-like glycosyltransferase
MAFSVSAALIMACYFVFLYCAIYWLVVFFESAEEKRKRLPKVWPTVTILIPAYNSEATIEKAVLSCLSLDYPKDKLRILAIDDGSTDSTFQKLKKFGAIMRVVRKRNSGKAGALNFGLRLVRTEFVSCLDADSFFMPWAMKELISEFRPGVGAVTSNIKVHAPKSGLERIQRLEYFFSIYLRRLMGRMDALYVVPGPGSAYRTEALRRVGGFDEDNLTEDMDIAFRIKEKGLRIANAVDGEVTTMAPSSLAELTRQRTRWYAGYFQNVEKHRKFILNPKFSELGLFILPINFVLILSITFVLLNSLFEIARSAVHLVRDFLLTGLDNLTPAPIRIQDLAFSFNTLNVFFVIFFVLSAFVIYTSFKMSRESFFGKRENLWDFLLYTVFYFPLISAFYLISVIYYFAFRRSRLKWRGRNLRAQGTS